LYSFVICVVRNVFITEIVPSTQNKKLSYRRETASASAAHMDGGDIGYTYACGRIRNPQQTYVKRAIHKKCPLRWIGHSRSFKVILIGADRNPERCVVVMCH